MAVVITVLSMIALPFLVAVYAMGESLTEINGAEYYCRMLGEMFFLVLFAVMILSCIPAASDAGDKTLNYELMAGHSRKKVFWARTVAGIMWGVILAAALYYLPLPVFGFIGGWYQGVSVKDVVTRIVLSLLPMFRITAFCIMLASIFRSAGKGIGFSFLAFEAADILWEVICGLLHLKDDACPYVMGMLNLVELHTLSNARDYVIEGERVTVYDTAVTPQLMYLTIIVSLVTGILYLTIAYADFKRRDRD